MVLGLFLNFVRWLKLSRVRPLKWDTYHKAPSLAMRSRVSRSPGSDDPCIPQQHYHPARARRQGPVLTALLTSAKLAAAFAFSLTCYGQGTIQLLQQTAPVTSANFNNINPRYNAWTVMYNYSGAGSFSVEFDCAADATTAGGTPTAGSFSACTNKVTGSNPSTTPNYGYITFVGYTPWLKLNVTAISSGNITVMAVGFVAADPESGGSSGCAGTAAAPCLVAGPDVKGAAATKNPLQGGGVDSANNLLPVVFCTSSAVVNASSMGENQIVALTSAKAIRICNLDVSFPSPAAFTLQIDTGTGSACGTGTAHLTGIYTFNSAVLGLFLDPGAYAPLIGPSGAAICLNLSAAVAVQGTIIYAVPF